jgi:NTP pyrophosphatase (non-canonical NTP hydrolase)
MEFSSMVSQANAIRRRYDNQNVAAGRPAWTAAEYMQGFVGDVGSLAKLIMTQNGLREGDHSAERLAHELADCLWSVIILAEELDIDLEQAFADTMTELESRFS